MKRLIVIYFAIIMFISCNTKQNNDSKEGDNSIKNPSEKSNDGNLPLYINTYTLIGTDVKKMKTGFSVVKSDYFEVGLNLTADQLSYNAGKELEVATSMEHYKSVSIQIVDKNGKFILFNNSTEFLNFMSSHGYAMVDQTKKEFGIDYTFKRK